MPTGLIVRSFPSLLTFEEQLLCRGAAQCGASGLLFIATTVREAMWRSFHLPKTDWSSLETRWSSWRNDSFAFQFASDSACNLIDASV